MRQDIFLEMSFMTKLEYDNGKFLDYFKTAFGAKIALSFFYIGRNSTKFERNWEDF